jgi:hypothetical protein
VKFCFTTLSSNFPLFCTVLLHKKSFGAGNFPSSHTALRAGSVPHNVSRLWKKCTKYSIENIFFPIELLINVNNNGGSRDSTVGIATGYWLEDQGVGVRVPVGSRIFSSTYFPERAWGLPSLVSNGYREIFLRGVKLTTHLQIVPRSRKRESIYSLSHTSLWRGA